MQRGVTNRASCNTWHDFSVEIRHLFTALFCCSLIACGGLSPASPEDTAPASGVVNKPVPLEVLNSDVRQDSIQATICVPGYTASVRPATSFTNEVKAKLLREQGLQASDAKNYELDHHIPLALGGHPRNLKNLMLQPWEGASGAKAKDRLERQLQRLVCTGNVPLNVAQREIYLDWQRAYRTYVQPFE